MLREFQYDAETFQITPDMQQAFDDDGAIIVRNLLNKDELDQVWKTVLGTDEYIGKAWELSDGEGRASRLVLWSHPGNDVLGMVARSERVAGTCEKVKLLGGEVYHYHSKIMMKEARTGGKHLWHQDYGYWYQFGCLKPDMMTCFVALDPCLEMNGGLQILKGTHRCGRIDHNLVHGQTVADQERIDQLSKQFEHLYADLNAGDALFFHCNVLHTSGRNDSELRRWALLMAFNRADNDPVLKQPHPNYTPLKKVPNCAIMDCIDVNDTAGKEFMDPSTTAAIRATLVQSAFH